MKEHELDALVTPRYDVSPFLAIGGFPCISVTAGYAYERIPFGICFGGLKCETPENPDFLRKDKMVISVKIQKFFRSRMTKRTSPLESSREI